MRDDGPPPWHRFAAEAGFVLDQLAGRFAARSIGRRHAGDGRPVMVIPGFLADDWMTLPLRRALVAAGYRAEGWELGPNREVDEARFAALEARLVVMAAGGPVALVGWSLGGLLARELAKRRPELVERVVTLGSPFSGDRRANRAWRLYERINGHSIDAVPIEVDLPTKPPVLTIALWSPRDGIVAPAGSRGLPGQADRAVAVACRHMGFVCAPVAIHAVLDALAPLPAREGPAVGRPPR